MHHDSPIGSLPLRPQLTLEAARVAIGAAERAIAEAGYAMCVAIVDDGGHLLLFERIAGGQTGSIEIAIAKARTAAGFRRETKVFEERLASGWNAILSLPGVVSLEGGVPIVADGHVVGAIGVSGGSAAQDGEVAHAAIAALGSPA